MKIPDAHPSFLELDRAALGAPSPGTLSHVEACARCQAHVREVQRPLPVCAWVEEAAAPSQSRSRRPWLAWAGGLSAAAVVAALLLVVVRGPAPQQPTEIKGGPAVGLYVKRADEVKLWNGSMRVLPGDLLRLQVAPGGYRRIAVGTAPAAGGDYAPLYAGEVKPKGESLLPESWKVDDSPGPERLGIALSMQPLASDRLSRALREGERSAEVWTFKLTLPKGTDPAAKDAP